MYEHIIAFVYNSVWAILPAKLQVILEVLQYRAAGGAYSADEVRARVGARREQPQPYLVAIDGALVAAAGQGGQRSGGAIQVLPLFGMIAHRIDMMMESSGGTSTERFTQQFRQAMSDPQVGAIVIDVDSPGGTVDGVPELADEIYRARGTKPIVAVADGMAASAAYHIASSASELLVSPSGEVGAIGVWSAHQDASGFYANEGIKTTLISAGKYKTALNPYEPLRAEAQALLQARVDAFYGMFVKAVARNRGVSADTVRNGFGEGFVVGAGEAVRQGMADHVGTLDDAITRASKLMRQAGSARSASAEAERALRLRMAGL
jgi:signal peptide peptidase SppA